MRSYGLGLGIVAFLAATFAIQNQEMTSIHFFIWNFSLPHGYFDVFLFFSGIVVMWGISLAAGLEARFRSRRELERCRRRIASLEKDRGVLLSAMKATGVSQEEITFIEDSTSL